jgi:hypothetical protein
MMIKRKLLALCVFHAIVWDTTAFFTRAPKARTFTGPIYSKDPYAAYYATWAQATDKANGATALKDPTVSEKGASVVINAPASKDPYAAYYDTLAPNANPVTSTALENGIGSEKAASVGNNAASLKNDTVSEKVPSNDWEAHVANGSGMAASNAVEAPSLTNADVSLIVGTVGLARPSIFSALFRIYFFNPTHPPVLPTLI